MPASAHEPSARLATQRLAAVSGELLLPTIGLLVQQHPDWEFRRAFSRAYNRWMAALWMEPPFLVPCALIPGADWTLRELSRLRSAGFRHVLLPSSPGFGENWRTADLHRLLGLASEVGFQVVVHGFAGAQASAGGRSEGALVMALLHAVSARGFGRGTRPRLIVAEMVIELRALHGLTDTFDVGYVTDATPGSPLWRDAERFGIDPLWGSDYPHPAGVDGSRRATTAFV